MSSLTVASHRLQGGLVFLRVTAIRAVSKVAGHLIRRGSKQNYGIYQGPDVHYWHTAFPANLRCLLYI